MAAAGWEVQMDGWMDGLGLPSGVRSGLCVFGFGCVYFHEKNTVQKKDFPSHQTCDTCMEY
jgi:hypothetical protein